MWNDRHFIITRNGTNGIHQLNEVWPVFRWNAALTASSESMHGMYGICDWYVEYEASEADSFTGMRIAQASAEEWKRFYILERQRQQGQTKQTNWREAATEEEDDPNWIGRRRPSTRTRCSREVEWWYSRVAAPKTKWREPKETNSWQRWCPSLMKTKFRFSNYSVET